MRSQMLLITAVALLAPTTASAQVSETLEKARVSVAVAQIKIIEDAVALYRLHHAAAPAKLEVLLEADANNASQPYLRDAKSLVGPWGKPFHYDADGPKNEGAKPDVWTETDAGKKVGNWAE